jgi:hypothetical protein
MSVDRSSVRLPRLDEETSKSEVERILAKLLEQPSGEVDPHLAVALPAAEQEKIWQSIIDEFIRLEWRGRPFKTCPEIFSLDLGSYSFELSGHLMGAAGTRGMVSQHSFATADGSEVRFHLIKNYEDKDSQPRSLFQIEFINMYGRSSVACQARETAAAVAATLAQTSVAAPTAELPTKKKVRKSGGGSGDGGDGGGPLDPPSAALARVGEFHRQAASYMRELFDELENARGRVGRGVTPGLAEAVKDMTMLMTQFAFYDPRFSVPDFLRVLTAMTRSQLQSGIYHENTLIHSSSVTGGIPAFCQRSLDMSLRDSLETAFMALVHDTGKLIARFSAAYNAKAHAVLGPELVAELGLVGPERTAAAARWEYQIYGLNRPLISAKEHAALIHLHAPAGSAFLRGMDMPSKYILAARYHHVDDFVLQKMVADGRLIADQHQKIAIVAFFDKLEAQLTRNENGERHVKRTLPEAACEMLLCSAMHLAQTSWEVCRSWLPEVSPQVRSGDALDFDLRASLSGSILGRHEGRQHDDPKQNIAAMLNRVLLGSQILWDDASKEAADFAVRKLILPGSKFVTALAEILEKQHRGAENALYRLQLDPNNDLPVLRVFDESANPLFSAAFPSGHEIFKVVK